MVVISLEIKKVKSLDFGTGVEYEIAPEWENVQNVPFLETVRGDTLTWDGDTSGKVVGMEYLKGFGETIKYVKVSDATPKFTDITDGFLISWIDGESVDFNSDEAHHRDSIILFENGIRVALEDEINYEDDEVSLYFPEKGTYFYIEGIEDYHGRTTTLTINGYTGFTKEQVKQGYLPNGTTVFYMNPENAEDKYLYIDNSGTIKATYQDVKKAMSGRIYVVLDGATYLIPLMIVDNFEYCSIEIYSSVFQLTMALTTSEYME